MNRKNQTKIVGVAILKKLTTDIHPSIPTSVTLTISFFGYKPAVELKSTHSYFLLSNQQTVNENNPKSA